MWLGKIGTKKTLEQPEKKRKGSAEKLRKKRL